ncbi:MAG: amidohydrolase family protein [Propionibacteriales bacterium]|nr:amidohydrolase family protein [Propionibacteriales bacterium]
MTVVDPDAHYMEDTRQLAEYLPEPMRTRIGSASPSYLLSNSVGDRWVMGRISRPEVNYPDAYSEPEEIPGIMKFLGVDISVQLPNRMLQLSTTGQKDVAVALADGFARYMGDRVVNPAEGVYSMIIAPFQDPPRAADIIYRHAQNPGMCAVCLITGGVSPPLGDTRYDPIYRAAQDVELPIVYHANGGSIDHFPIRGFQQFLETHTLGFLFYNLATLTSMLVQGVPERFPRLRFAFQEAGLFYIPMLMHRLDAAYRKRRAEAPLLKHLPSEYMRDFRYGTQPMEEPNKEEHLEMIFEMIDGPNTLVFSTDYPHWDYDLPSKITNLSFLSQTDKEQILGGNALNFYRFEGR